MIRFLFLLCTIDHVVGQCVPGDVQCDPNEIEAIPPTEELDYDLDPNPPGLNPPHGGVLVDLMTDDPEGMRKVSATMPTISLNDRQIYDTEMLISGAFSPLNGFMTRGDYDGVVDNMRLKSGLLWPLPITMDIDEIMAKVLMDSSGKPMPDAKVALRDKFYNLIAILEVEDIWMPDKEKEAKNCYDPDWETKSNGVLDREQPAIKYVLDYAGPYYIGGKVIGVQMPGHYDYNHLRHTPRTIRDEFTRNNWQKVVAFQTRNPMHRVHIELARHAGRRIGAKVLINPVVGPTKPGDVGYEERVQCYETMLRTRKYFRPWNVKLALLPLSMRMAGPKEAMLHSIIRKNHGVTHFIIGRDHAGCKRSKTLGGGEDFYDAMGAQELMGKHADEIGITLVLFPAVHYVPSLNKYFPSDELPKDLKTLAISGTKFRKMLEVGDPIPKWFSDPAVMDVLYRHYPPRTRRGLVLFFTGLSGSGKTTVSQALQSRLRELEAEGESRQISMFDGDVVRTHLSKGLGFSKVDRDENIRRIGFVCGEIARHSGIAVAVAIAPFEDARQEARKIVEAKGGSFVEVFMDTSVETCERRDVKGLYNKARKGLINLTGINDPFEAPSKPDIILSGEDSTTVEQQVEKIIEYLVENNYYSPTISRGSRYLMQELVPQYRESGTLGKHDYSFFYRNNSKGVDISPWHDIPMMRDNNVNFVVEIPKYSRAKMECQKDVVGNPLKQDVNKDGSVRFFSYGDCPFNYGFIPQTWEDPDVKINFQGKQIGGDNDPIDVIEVGSMLPFGAVVPVRVLGNLRLIDQGEVDHKVLVISLDDPLARFVHTIEDLNRYRPGFLPRTIDWLVNYKTTDGKAKNVLASEIPDDQETTMKIIAETHEAWAKLVNGKRNNPGFHVRSEL